MGDAPRSPWVNTTNELARERNRAAAERTLNVWIGLCLSLIGFGVAFEQIASSLQRAAPMAILADSNPALVGLGFAGLGLWLLGLALVQHRLTLTALEQSGNVLPSIKRLNRWAVVAIVLVGVAGLGVTLLLP